MLDRELLIKSNVCQPAISRIADDTLTQSLYKKSVKDMTDKEKILAMQKEGNYEYAYWGMAYCMDIADKLILLLLKDTGEKPVKNERKGLLAEHKRLATKAETLKDKGIYRALADMYSYKLTGKSSFVFRALCGLQGTKLQDSAINELLPIDSTIKI